MIEALRVEVHCLAAGVQQAQPWFRADRTYSLLNGRLGERFIATPAQVPQRLADFDLRPDPDGRDRVNECYCFDGTWQAALVQRADVVLMDLRGFQAKTRGAGTNLACCHRRRTCSAWCCCTTNAPTGRLVWVDAGKLSSGVVRQILCRLLG